MAAESSGSHHQAAAHTEGSSFAATRDRCVLLRLLVRKAIDRLPPRRWPFWTITLESKDLALMWISFPESFTSQVGGTRGGTLRLSHALSEHRVWLLPSCGSLIDTTMARAYLTLSFLNFLARALHRLVSI